MKKILLVAIFVTILSSLLVNQTFAHQINVFAPGSYAGNVPSYPSAFLWWGTWSAPLTPSSATLNPSTGDTTLYAIPAGALSGGAMSWFDTGWWLFTNVTQKGSVTADTWLRYNITGQAGIRAYLWVWDYNPSTNTWQVWQETAYDGVPGARENSFDLNVNPYDLSIAGSTGAGSPFLWTTGHWYYARVLLYAFAAPGSFFGAFDGKFDDILFITYTSSPGQDFVDPLLSPTITLSPVLGPIGTPVAVSGQGFAPGESVTLYWDSQPMNQTLADANGSFFDIFVDVPAGSTLGSHLIRAVGASNDSANSFFDVFTPVSPLVGDLNGDGKVSLSDFSLFVKNFNRVDPNLDPPAPAQQPTTGSQSAVALAAAISLALIEIRRKTQKKPKA